MTRTELKGQGSRLDTYLQVELQYWRQTTWWRAGPKRQTANPEMLRWCLAFIRFYVDVLKCNQDIEVAFCRWVDTDQPFDTISTRVMNRPQLRCHDLYRAAKRQIELAESETAMKENTNP